MGTMTDREFAQKVDWEGGVLSAIFDYGLSSEDLADDDSDLARALRLLEEVKDEFENRLARVENLAEELLD